MMYSVTVLFDASRSVSVEADTPEAAEEKAHQEVGTASLCHQCSDEINMGDATGAVVYEDDGDGPQVLDTQWSSERIAALQAEVDALKADAVRYRFLRRGQHWDVINGIGDSLRAEALDAAVDARAAASGAAQGDDHAREGGT